MSEKIQILDTEFEKDEFFRMYERIKKEIDLQDVKNQLEEYKRVLKIIDEKIKNQMQIKETIENHIEWREEIIKNEQNNQ